MTKFKIEKGVPMPIVKLDLGPWKMLEIGESYFFPCEKDRRALIAGRILSTARAANIKSTWDGKLSTRRTPDGVRIWRIK